MNIKITVLVLYVIASLTAHTAFAQTAPSQSAVVANEQIVIQKTDSRVVALENVFKRYSSPLQGQARHYVKYADKHGMDWRLLPAIAGLESTFGKRLMPGSHNAYGWGGGHIYFRSWEHGIDTINKALAEKYAARGATTVWTIGPIYAESPTWAVRVNNFMNQIEREHTRIHTENLPLTI